MAHRGFSEGVRGSFILVAWLILEGCSSSSKVPATPKCFLASDCQNLLQCVQGYCVKACAQSRDCPNGERCITAAEGIPVSHWRRPLASTTASARNPWCVLSTRSVAINVSKTSTAPLARCARR